MSSFTSPSTKTSQYNISLYLPDRIHWGRSAARTLSRNELSHILGSGRRAAPCRAHSSWHLPWKYLYLPRILDTSQCCHVKLWCLEGRFWAQSTTVRGKQVSHLRISQPLGSGQQASEPRRRAGERTNVITMLPRSLLRWGGKFYFVATRVLRRTQKNKFCFYHLLGQYLASCLHSTGWPKKNATSNLKLVVVSLIVGPTKGQ